MKAILIGFFSILFLNHPMVLQAASKPTDQILQKKAQAFLESSIAHSLTVAIYYQGQETIAHFGELDPHMRNPPTRETVYEIASVSKTFAGLLAAKAVLDGKLTLDTDIRKFLEGPYPNLEKEGIPITVKHLVTHTSGLPDEHKGISQLAHQPSEVPLWQRRFLGEKLYSKSRFLSDLQTLSLGSTPGTHFQYSNLGTNLMAHILERIYGQSFETMVRAHIWNPASMKDTHMTLSGSQRYHLANGYNEEGLLMPPLPLGYTLWGAEGGVKSTAPDMIRYMRFLLAKPNPLVAEAQKRLHRLDNGYWMGYFWWVINLKNGVNDISGIKTIRHDGGATGTRNVFRVYPEHDLGIWVVTNIVGKDIFNELTKLSYSLADEILKESGHRP